MLHDYVVVLAEEQVLDVVSELKSEVDQQRHKSRTLEREIKQKNIDIEAVCFFIISCGGSCLYTYLNIILIIYLEQLLLLVYVSAVF